jgi:two-component system sensor histidine kinase MtrB
MSSLTRHWLHSIQSAAQSGYKTVSHLLGHLFGQPVGLKKLALTNALLVGISTLITAAALFGLAHLQSVASKAGETGEESIFVAEEIENQLLRMDRDSLMPGALLKSPVRMKVFRDHLDQLISDSEKFADTRQEVQMLAEAKTLIAQYFVLRDRLENSRLDPVEIRQTLAPRISRLRTLFENFLQINLQQARDTQRRSALQETYANFIAAAAILGVLATTVIWLFLQNSQIYQPILSLQETMAQYTQGKFENRALSFGIREIRNVFAEFNDMAAKLSRQNEDRLRYLASIAHDLRNPLGAIRMSAELLGAEAKLSSEDRVLTEIMQRQANALERMVGDLLDLTRIEAGQLEINFARVDLRPVLGDVWALFRNLSPSHEILIELPDEPVVGSVDATRINQVVTNLVSNAIKYSPFGGRIVLSLSGEEASLRISVKDQGMGIESGDLNSIFEPFKRSAAVKSAIPGIGLGLSASLKIVTAHGGRIEVASQVGLGSVFTIHLPMERKVRSSGVVPSEQITPSAPISAELSAGPTTESNLNS